MKMPSGIKKNGLERLFGKGRFLPFGKGEKGEKRTYSSSEGEG